MIASDVEELPLVAVYADESCLGNGREGDNPGGAGVLVECLRPRSRELVRLDLWISERATTNNRMALRSVSEAFEALSARGARCRVVFTSDSRYLIDGLTKWVHGWARNGWRRKAGAIENYGLWRDVIRAADGHRYDWRWVRGHRGHIQNEYANHLATTAAAQLASSQGLIPSGYEAWLEFQRARGKMLEEPASFPTDAEFRPCAQLPPVPPERH